MIQSNNTAIIGKGLIGQRLAGFIDATHVFDSRTIRHLPDDSYETLYVAAPSANRIWAKENPNSDTASVDALIRSLRMTDAHRVVLISTCDTQVSPDTVYGDNRRRLEEFVHDWFPHNHVVRLPCLIGNDITKNILYDIKHKTQWMHNINLGTTQQWYILDDLEQDLKHIMQSYLPVTVDNLVSEPISNKDIVSEFLGYHSKIQLDQPGTAYDLDPYKYTKDEIFTEIKRYLNDSTN